MAFCCVVKGCPSTMAQGPYMQNAGLCPGCFGKLTPEEREELKRARHQSMQAERLTVARIAKQIPGRG